MMKKLDEDVQLEEIHVQNRKMNQWELRKYIENTIQKKEIETLLEKVRHFYR